MIRAEELRSGNWVKIVTSTYEHEVKQEHWKCSGQTIYLIEEKDIEVEGIPITEEVLLKCGFVRDSIEHYHLSTKPNMPLYRRGVYIGCIGLGLSAKEFEYLHQLQNRYFSITGQELIYTP